MALRVAVAAGRQGGPGVPPLLQDLLDHLNLTRAAMALRGQWALVAELAGVEP